MVISASKLHDSRLVRESKGFSLMTALIRQIRSSHPGSCQQLCCELRWLSISTTGKRSAGKWTLLVLDVLHRSHCGLQFKYRNASGWFALPSGIDVVMIRLECGRLQVQCACKPVVWLREAEAAEEEEEGGITSRNMVEAAQARSLSLYIFYL